MERRWAEILALCLVVVTFFVPDVIYAVGDWINYSTSRIVYLVLKSTALIACLYYGAWRILVWGKNGDDD